MAYNIMFLILLEKKSKLKVRLRSQGQYFVKAPKSRGFSYIEVWMFGTHCPVFFALFEYGFILYLKKVTKKSEELDEKIKKFDFTMLFLVQFSLQLLYPFTGYSC